MSVQKLRLYFYIALICAIWFSLTSWFWTYLANLFISFPFGILSFLLWNKGKKTDSYISGYKAIAIILSFGIAASGISMVLFLCYN